MTATQEKSLGVLIKICDTMTENRSLLTNDYLTFRTTARNLWF